MALRTIGLIGGMSFEGSAVYYRLINEGVRERLGGLHSAEMLMHSVDFQDIVDMQKTDRWNDAAERLCAAARGLEDSGAKCLLICANTMHIVADAVEASVGIPLINIIDATAKRLKLARKNKPLLLATTYTMEHGFYAERMKRHNVEVILPSLEGRLATHDIIFNELCVGKVRDASRDTLTALVEKAIAEGADSVILGCTELGLILDPNSIGGFDSTRIHVDAAVDFALGATGA